MGATGAVGASCAHATEPPASKTIIAKSRLELLPVRITFCPPYGMLVCLLHTLESQLLPQPRRSTRQLAVQYSLRPRPSLSQTKQMNTSLIATELCSRPVAVNRLFHSLSPRAYALGRSVAVTTTPAFFPMSIP